ncbi:glycosyltransferase family 9 protein [bacterium]|nr:glycosyltransferase family 9 protein [bacterium]
MSIFLKKLKHIPKNILISRTDRIGDFILSLPVFEALKTETNAKVSVLCNELTTPLLDNNPFVDAIISTDSFPNHDSLIKKIVSYQFDALLVLVNDSVILNLLPDLKSIPVRIGPLSKPQAFFKYTHPVLQKRSKSVQNEAEYNLELLKIFNINTISPVKPRLYISRQETNDFEATYNDLFNFINKSPTIVFHAGMNGSALNWKLEYYQLLLLKILKSNFNVVLTGSGESESDTNRQLLKSAKPTFSGQIIDVSNKLNLRELAVSISLSHLFIGPSTGPTHIANAVNTPLISFYPPIKVQSAKRWEPYLADSHIFSPEVDCRQKYNCLGDKCEYYECFDLITPDIVMEQIMKIKSNRSMCLD